MFSPGDEETADWLLYMQERIKIQDYQSLHEGAVSLEFEAVPKIPSPLNRIVSWSGGVSPVIGE